MKEQCAPQQTPSSSEAAISATILACSTHSTAEAAAFKNCTAAGRNRVPYFPSSWLEVDERHVDLVKHDSTVTEFILWSGSMFH